MALALSCAWGYLALTQLQNSKMTLEEVQSEIESLEAQLTGDMFQDMEIRDKIHNLKMKLNGTRPINSEIECVGCGS